MKGGHPELKTGLFRGGQPLFGCGRGSKFRNVYVKNRFLRVPYIKHIVVWYQIKGRYFKLNKLKYFKNYLSYPSHMPHQRRKKCLFFCLRKGGRGGGKVNLFFIKL